MEQRPALADTTVTLAIMNASQAALTMTIAKATIIVEPVTACLRKAMAKPVAQVTSVPVVVV